VNLANLKTFVEAEYAKETRQPNPAKASLKHPKGLKGRGTS
jgi:hypothetical protein